MKKTFYSHIVNIDILVTELEKLPLSEEERAHLLSLIDSSLEHVVLDAILSELSEEDKRMFLKHVAHDNHDEVWVLLKEKIEDIEGKIKRAADELTKEMHEDIQETKN